jgi:predicted ATPase
MKIQRLVVDGLHGYLSFEFSFFPDLTFLVGINGSGKTSAVRAIMALLTPAIRDLARIDFGRLEVEVIHDDVARTIIATRTPTEVILSIGSIPEALIIPILPLVNFEPRHAFEERELAYYRDQEASNASHPVMAAITELPTPMFLDLERRAQIGVGRRSPTFRTSLNKHHVTTPTLLGGTLIESLRDAESLAESAYRDSLARQRELADQLKHDLILTHFSIPSGSSGFLRFDAPSKDAARQLKKRQGPIADSLRAIGLADAALSNTVAPFFSAAIELATLLQGKDLLQVLSTTESEPVQRWLALQPQLERIETVNDHVERYNRAVYEIGRPIQRYLDLVNRFLKDSRKALAFSRTGDLQVVLERGDRGRPITALSSGERQLVVILTHLMFNRAAREANILIIDEPELSLHLRWQEQFVAALQGASEGLQLILATHSPSIILDRETHCVDVLEGSR